MQILRRSLLSGAALLLVGSAAQAQYREWGREMIGGVRADLDRAERDVRYLPEGEMRDFRRVRERLGEFEHRWERGRFEKGLLDDAIGGLQHLVDRARLRERDRDILAGDARRLRELRERFDREHEHRR